MRSLFLAASFGTSFILFFAAFKTNKISISRESLLIGLFLSLGTICSTLGIMEVLSGSINEIIESKSNRLEAPNIIARYKTQPHTRIKDSILYLAPTNQNFRSFGHEYKTNGMGFRERSFTFKKKAQTFRILVFGDSLTFGVAVSDEQRYTNLLETLLNMSYNKKPSSDYTGLPVADGVIKNDHVEILNFGVPGYTLDQERDLMTVILKLVECDLVIVGVIDDDLNMTTRHSLRGFTINEGNDSVTIPIYKNLERTYQTIPENQPKLFFRSSLWFESLSLFQLLDLKTEWFADNALPTASRWNYALREFSSMKELTQQHNLPPPIIALLHYGGVNPDGNDFKNPKGKLAKNIRVFKFIGSELRVRGFYVADTLPMFKENNRMALAVSEWEWHPNYLGHYNYAQTLLDFLWNNKLLR